MCPILLAGISATAQLAGGAVSGMGSIAQGKAADKAAQMNAQELNYQAELERQRKNIENANAEQDLQRLGLDAQADQASALTQFAAGGQSIGNGGFVQRYLEDSARVTAREEGIVKYNRDVANWGHDANANSLQNQSILTRMQGKRAKRAGYYGAAGALLSGAGSATGSYATLPSSF